MQPRAVGPGALLMGPPGRSPQRAIVKSSEVLRLLSAFCLLKKKKKATNKAVSRDPTCN